MKKETKKPVSRTIEIDGIKFIPVNLDTEYSIEDNNFAIEHVSEHMGTILSLNENLTEINKANLTGETDNLSLAGTYAAMANIKITPELLSLVYKRQGDDYLVPGQRDENIELFRNMRGKVNYDKAKDACVNFTSFISKITSDGMLIYSIATTGLGIAPSSET